MLLTLLIACFIPQSLQTELIPKCCPKKFEVREFNNSLECIEQTYSRRDVWADSYDFLAENNEGECVDLNAENFFVFTLNGSDLVSKKPASSLTVFPKCCPLDHVYDKATHSCVASLNSTSVDFEGQLIEIGLPRCKTILDKTFKSASEARAKARGLERGIYCLDKDVKDEYVIRECQEGLNICKQKRCFRKCCADGQSFVNGGTCRDTYVHGLKLQSQGFSPYIVDPDDEYELIYGVKCDKVSLMKSNTIQYTIKKRGEFSYFHSLNGTFVEHDFGDPRSYCLEHATKGKLSGYHLFLCMYKTELNEKFSYTLWSKILSCVFLVLTIVIYFYLGEVKSTFGKILMNYCVTMLLLMVTLIVTHASRQPDRLSCKIKAYLLIFFNMSAFAWVNVMSLDIWWTFGTPRRTIGSDQRKKDLKKFLLYVLYGWGMPLCHTLIILVFESTSVLPEPIQPYVGIFICFLENRNYARTVLFLVPQLIFQIINTVLFIKTITYCIRVKNEIIKMNDTTKNKENGRFSAERERLGLIVKLAVIMGVIWIFEVTTAFFDNMKTYSDFTKILEVILDNVTCLQGVFIFLIFICKKKTLNSLKTKLKIRGRRMSCSMSVTQSSHVNGHYPMNKRQMTTLSMNESKI